ncbi:MAG TPA: universal stress protein [Anaeromyxobacter sp.]
MDLKDLAVHLDSGARAAERTRLALALARRHGARLTGLFAESPTLGASIVGRRSPDAVARAAEEARARFEAACGEAGVPSRFWRLDAEREVAGVIDAVVSLCRRVDLAVFGQQRGDPAPVPDGLVERVIAESGRPVIVIPSAGSYRDVGRRVLVAWSGSRESARALHDALPILERAERVSVLALLSPGEGAPGRDQPAALVEHLGTHGVAAAYDRWVVGDFPAVDVVLNRISDEAADLAVVGAWGLGGVVDRQGTTRVILETMTAPVLLSS